MHEWGGSAAIFADAPTLGDGAKAGGAMRGRLQERLAGVLCDEFLPRLMASPRKASAEKRPQTVARADPDALARLVVTGGMAQAREFVRARLRSGASAQSVMLEDIAAAARRLGDFWRDDDFDFLAVTFAARALRLLLRDVPADPGGLLSAQAPSVILTLAPGETHELGADVAAGLFRLAGWRVERCEADDLPEALAREAFDVAGFSLSCERFAGTLAGAVAKARAAARPRDLTILVGGAVFAAKPGLAKKVGADVEASNGDIALWPHRLRKALRK